MLYALGVFGRLCRLFAEDSLEQNLTVRSLLGLSFKPCGLAFGIDEVSTICIFTVARCKPANRWCICSARIKMFTIGFSTKMDPRVLCDRVRRKLYGAILASARIVSLRELPCHLTVIFQSTKRILFFMLQELEPAFLLQKANRPLCNLPRPM